MTSEQTNAVHLKNNVTGATVTIVYLDGLFTAQPPDGWMTPSVAGVVSEHNIVDAETIAKVQALKDASTMTPAEFKATRLRFDLTQEQFGQALGITANSVARLERGAGATADAN